MVREDGERRAQAPGAARGVIGLGDRPHHDHTLRTGGDDLLDGGLVDTADREPRPRRSGIGRVADEIETDPGAAGLRRRRPHRADAEIVQVGRGDRGVHLLDAVGGEPDRRLRADDGPGDRDGQILLTEVQHRSLGDQGDVGAVVDRPELPVPGGDLGEDGQDFELLAALQGLVPQLDDVDASGERRVHEVGEVALTGAGVGAEVELRGGEGHEVSVSGVGNRSERTVVDVAVVGGGIIGLAIAWRIGRSGRTVRLFDPAPARAATFAAAGMLAPVSEYHYQEDTLLPLMLASAARYPEFIRELSPNGEPTGYLPTETLLVGIDAGDRQALADLHSAHRRWNLDVQRLTIGDARAQEPLLGPRVTSAYLVGGDRQVDPRTLAARLVDDLIRTGRGVIVRERVVALLHADSVDQDSRVTGVRTENEEVEAEEVVLANGLDAKELEALPAGLHLPLRPVSGDILRLRVPVTLRPLLTATVRGLVHGESVYLVPRSDGTLVIGATQREDAMLGVSAGAVHRLLRDAQALLPAVADLELVEATARARPATPDNAPLLGRVTGPRGADVRGLIVATGFFRHGVLLAPIAADICLRLIDGEHDQRWDDFRPDRFATRNSPRTIAGRIRA